jgi:triphosphoribosyl-dephospho-CoA synthase
MFLHNVNKTFFTKNKRMGILLQTSPFNKAKHISQCLELGILFEISADKPGNVNLVVGFEGTRYEHFLASAVAAAPSFERAAERGIAVFHGEIKLTEIALGRIIRNCVEDIHASQSGGNTLLGTVLLLVPIAVAAGMTPTNGVGTFEVSELRRNMRLAVESTTSEDAVEVYEAIRIANPSGLNKAPELDVNDSNSKRRILEERISLYQVFKIAEKYDNVCSEWVNNYPITFDVAYPFLIEQIEKTEDLNLAVTHTFLKVLADYPDSFIARKVGIEKARKVSFLAKEILKSGGLATPEGKDYLKRFDLTLRKSDSLLNPGTTADIIAAALALCVLCGYKP